MNKKRQHSKLLTIVGITEYKIHLKGDDHVKGSLSLDGSIDCPHNSV